MKHTFYFSREDRFGNYETADNTLELCSSGAQRVFGIGKNARQFKVEVANKNPKKKGFKKMFFCSGKVYSGKLRLLLYNSAHYFLFRLTRDSDGYFWVKATTIPTKR